MVDFIFDNFDAFMNGGLIFSGIFFLFTISFMVFIFYSMFSKKGRSKFIGKQLDISKQVLEDNKDVIQDLGELGSSINIKTKRSVMENNEDDLYYMSQKGADIEAEAIKRKARAFKEGFGDFNSTSTNTTPQKFCKYCGHKIDLDSKFCSNCGEKQ